MNWLRKQWLLIEGNVKFYVLTAIVGGVIGVATYLVRGLSMLQGVGLAWRYIQPCQWRAPFSTPLILH